VLLQFLKTAWDDLLLELENHHVPTTKEVSDTITIVAGATTVTLPSNLVEVTEVKERTQGSSEDWINMEETNWPLLNYTADSELHYWSWMGDTLRVNPSTADRDILIRYRKVILASSSIEESTNLPIINCMPFLSYKTAAIAADLSGRAPEVALRLETRAAIALNKILALKVGGMQSDPIRRRGFNSPEPVDIYKVT